MKSSSSLLRYRQVLISIHVLTAGFFLAAAVMFAVTGGLYTFGVRGGYETRKLALNLTLPSEPKLSELEEVARRILRENGVEKMPSGSPSVRKVGTSWSFEWSGVNHEFSLEPTSESGTYQASIKNTDSHRFFVQLHKAKGGLPFKILAAAMAIGLISLFLGGAMLAFTTRALKRNFLWSFFIGAAAFAIAALSS